MAKTDGDYWWLLALEATLFFSMPFWEGAAIYHDPCIYPFRFAGLVLIVATVAMLVFHIGPAFYAAKFGGQNHRLSIVLWVALAVGFITPLIRSGVWFAEELTPRGRPIVGALVAFLATVLLASLVKSWWKPAAGVILVIGVGLLTWALATSWTGLWLQNPYSSGEHAPPDETLEELLTRGLLLSAAPSVVVGWRIGRMQTKPSQIWMSGLLGVWLPLVISVTMAALATEAGLNRYWVPSLGRGFNWAIGGIHGKVEPIPKILAGLTALGPAILYFVGLKQTAPQWLRKRYLWTIPLAAGLAFLCYLGPVQTPWTDFEIYWAGSLALLGVLAGLAVLISRRFPTTAPEN